MTKNKLHFFKVLCVLCLLMGVYCTFNFYLPKLRVRRNISSSLPFWFFTGTPLRKVEKGMYVSLRHPRSSINLAKQVVGIPGDEIKIEKGHVVVNGNSYGALLQKGKSGKALTSIPEGRIPDNFYFVHASHPESFDSRYSEFGLIHIEQIEETLWPLF